MGGGSSSREAAGCTVCSFSMDASLGGVVGCCSTDGDTRGDASAGEGVRAGRGGGFRDFNGVGGNSTGGGANDLGAVVSAAPDGF